MERDSALQQAGVLQQKQTIQTCKQTFNKESFSADGSFLSWGSHLQLDDSQQVLLGSVQNGAALTEEDGVRVPPGVCVVKHL